MEYGEYRLKELVEMIINNVGVPLPTYDYEYRKYISSVPVNISLGDGAIGIDDADMHDTFRDACTRILEWNDEEFN